MTRLFTTTTIAALGLLWASAGMAAWSHVSTVSAVQKLASAFDPNQGILIIIDTAVPTAMVSCGDNKSLLFAGDDKEDARAIGLAAMLSDKMLRFSGDGSAANCVNNTWLAPNRYFRIEHQ